MGMPPEHAALLRRGGYPIHPAARLDDRERELLSKYGYWLEALARGTLSPSTPEQKQFVRVTRGEAEARSPFEVAWTKHQRAVLAPQPGIGPMELMGLLEKLQAARAAAVPVREEYAERRAAILEQVKPLLEALDTEFADYLRASDEEVSRLEAEARAAVLAFGASFRHAGVRALYARARVTWDSHRLARYIETHPELAEFRRIGKPSVSLRFDALPDAAARADAGTAHAGQAGSRNHEGSEGQ